MTNAPLIRTLLAASCVFVAGCAGVVGSAAGEVSGVVTWTPGTGMPRMTSSIVVYDSTLGRHVRVPDDVVVPEPRATPRSGLVVQARPMYRGGVLQRFRWRSARPVAEAVTDSLGTYVLRVPPGRYLVSVRLPGCTRCSCSPPMLVGNGLSVSDRIGTAVAVVVGSGEALERDLGLHANCPQ